MFMNNVLLKSKLGVYVELQLAYLNILIPLKFNLDNKSYKQRQCWFL